MLGAHWDRSLSDVSCSSSSDMTWSLALRDSACLLGEGRSTTAYWLVFGIRRSESADRSKELARFTVLAAVLDAAIDPSRKRGASAAAGFGARQQIAVISLVHHRPTGSVSG